MAAPPSIRPARIEEALALSELCVRSKGAWGYDEAFMALARAVLQVCPRQIAARDVWVATGADGEVAGIVALGPSEEPDTLDLDKLFVEPQRIRTGIGRALIAHAINQARRRRPKASGRFLPWHAKYNEYRVLGAYSGLRSRKEKRYFKRLRIKFVT